MPPASAYFTEPGYVPLRRNLPSAIDLMESSLYWMQDMAGVAALAVILVVGLYLPGAI